MFVFQKLAVLIMVLRVLDISLSLKVRETITAHLKESDTIGKFKVAVKKWKLESCLCRLGKVDQFSSDLFDQYP